MVLFRTVPGVGTYRIFNGRLVIDSETSGRRSEVTSPRPGTGGREWDTVTVSSSAEFDHEVAAAERRRLQ